MVAKLVLALAIRIFTQQFPQALVDDVSVDFVGDEAGLIAREALYRWL